MIRRIGFIIALLAATLAPGLANAQWTAPSAAPPSGNASSPVNVGATTQSKSGTFLAGSFGSSGGAYFLGNVAIGASSPSYPLDVTGSVLARNGWFRTTGETGWYSETYGGGWYMLDATWIRSYNNKPVFMSAGLDTSSVSSSGVGCDGGLGGGYMLRVCGSAAASAFYYTSDRNLKKDIVSLDSEDALAGVLKLQGVSFKWKDSKSGTGAQIGLVAQDVEKVYPELVNQNDAGIKSVEYGNLVAPLIEAIKAQQRQIDELKAEVAALRNK